MIKACLFDLDGTLLDTLKSLRYYVNRHISKKGIREISEAETKIFVGRGAKNLISSVLESRGYDLSNEKNSLLRDCILRDFLEEYNREPLYLTEPYDGICDVIKELHKSEIKLAVISNKPDTTTKQLIKKFFPGKFLIIEGASESFALKPDKVWPLDICKRLCVSPGEVMYVGDTSTDMKTAKNFGAALSVGVLWGFRDKKELMESGADVTISHPKELLKLVIEKNKMQGEK